MTRSRMLLRRLVVISVMLASTALPAGAQQRDSSALALTNVTIIDGSGVAPVSRS